MNTGLPPTLVDIISRDLRSHLESRAPGHCVRVDDLAPVDAHAVARAVVALTPEADVHVLAVSPSDPLEVAADRAIELRNRKRRPFLLLVPTGTSKAASSLDNSFEPLSLKELLLAASESLERELAGVGLVAAVKRVLGRGRRVESWAQFLGAVRADPASVGAQLWRLGLVPDLGEDPQARLRSNAEAVAAIARPSRPTARVGERLAAANVREDPTRELLRLFLERDAGLLSDAMAWTGMLGADHPGRLTFEQWPLVEHQQAAQTALAVKPFRKPNGSLDATSKLRIEDDLLYCPVASEQPGKVVVKWSTQPGTVASVASWRVEILPPDDLRTDDTVPVVTTTVKGSKRQATLRVDADEDDVARGNLFVVRVQALDRDGNDLDLAGGGDAVAESEQFEIRVGEESPHRTPRRTSARSLPEAVLRTAVEAGGDLTEDAPVWDTGGQVLSVRIGGRRMTLVRVSRVLVALQRRIAASSGVVMAFDVHSPFGEIIDPDLAQPVTLALPPTLAERRRKLMATMAERSPRDVVEALHWDDDLRDQARVYLQTYRRAFTSADAPTRSALLTMDTVAVRVGTGSSAVQGVVLLPTHPLRLAWVAAHDTVLRDWASQVAAIGSAAERAALVDLKLAARVSPANLPFITVDRDGTPLVYAEELTHGSALYLRPDVAEPLAASETLCGAIDVIHESADASAAGLALRERVQSYRRAHPGTAAVRIMAVNPGSGSVLAPALRSLALPESREDADSGEETGAMAPARVEVIAYGDRFSYTDPVASLREIQQAVAASDNQRIGTHLAPPMGLAARRLSRLVGDREGHHIAVVQDLARGSVTAAQPGMLARSAAFNDLLTPSVSERSASAGAAEWLVAPALKPRGASRIESEIVDTHRIHQEATGKQLGIGAGTQALAIRIRLEPGDMERLKAAHERADWVATLDRGIGLDLFENPTAASLGDEPYLLDYAPDFLEGLGKRLTVTTAHREEVLRILGGAMRALDLSEVDGSAEYVLNRLALVSGRLALRLLGDNTFAREAVSLAALVAHLDKRGQLAGRIVVPVDAHPEIFGQHLKVGDEAARRCDMLLVQVTQRSLRIECVEVKARRHTGLAVGLADDIVDQLDNTERVLRRQFFASDPPRLDGALQRSRLAGLLHYYADRAAHHGLILDKFDELHRNIDRIEDQTDPPEITKRGFVISMEGNAGYPSRHRGVPITVLTADDLGQAGFTPRTPQPPSPGRPPTPPSGPTPPPGPAAGNTEVAEDASEAEEPEKASSAGSVAGQSEAATTPTDTAAGDGTASRATDEDSAHEPGVVTVVLGRVDSGSTVEWTVSTKGSPHAFILGIPGQGKSVTTRRIVNEFDRQGLPSLIFDFHGDMASALRDVSHVIDAAAGLPFSPFELTSDDPRQVNQTAWEIAEIIEYIFGLGEVQRTTVYNGLRQGYLVNGPGEPPAVPTMAEFAAAVEAAEEKAKGRNARDRIRPLTDFGLFADDPASTFASTWDSGIVIDLSRLHLETVQRAATAFLLRKIYREMFRWGQAARMRLAVVLDEAHRMAKDKTLPKIMKEGRKYGVSVVVASQGAADFHADVLGNAGTKIIFRTNYPASKDAAAFLRGRDGQDLSRQLEQLSVGCAYVFTPDHRQVRKVYMEE